MRLIGHLNLRSIKVNKEGQGRNFYDSHNYDRKTIEIGIDKIVGIEEFNLTGKAEIDQGMNKIIEEEILEAMQGHIKILEERIAEENIEVIIEMKIQHRER